MRMANYTKISAVLRCVLSTNMCVYQCNFLLSESVTGNVLLVHSYFRVAVQSFDQQMQTYKQQIDDMENYMATLTGDAAISPQGM